MSTGWFRRVSVESADGSEPVNKKVVFSVMVSLVDQLTHRGPVDLVDQLTYGGEPVDQ